MWINEAELDSFMAYVVARLVPRYVAGTYLTEQEQAAARSMAATFAGAIRAWVADGHTVSGVAEWHPERRGRN